LDEKTREKIYYNIWKSTQINDSELFKKLHDEILEFRTFFNKNHYRFFAFWDKTKKENTVVISTHGIIKKTNKTPMVEIERAEHLKQQFYTEKK